MHRSTGSARDVARPLDRSVAARLVVAYVLGLGLALGGTATVASAEAGAAGTGTLVGQLVYCKLLPHPMNEVPDGISPLADVTPGGNRGRVGQIQVPAADVPLMVRGTSLSTRTDNAGRFTLADVPASQPLTVVAQVPGPVVAHVPGPTVLSLSVADAGLAAGQTLDLGTVGLVGCGDLRVVVGQIPDEPDVQSDGGPSDEVPSDDVASSELASDDRSSSDLASNDVSA
jgi:hypothetical protein